MAKLKNPLISLAAVGGLGQAVTFSKRCRTSLVSEKSMPRDPGTAAQSGQRQNFLDCITDWHALTLAEKRTWQANASRYHLTGYQYFMRTCLLTPPVPPPVPQLYEWQDAPNSNNSWGGTTWYGQSFTPQASHDITSVRLKLRTTAPAGVSPVIVSVQGVTPAQTPDGVDLTSLTIPASDLPLGVNIWTEFIFPSNPTLSLNTMYVIVFRCPTAPVASLWFMNTFFFPPYARGHVCFSLNGGVLWGKYLNQDMSFEDWGVPA